LFISFQVKGKKNIPQHGPFLIVSNHLSYADTPFLGLSFGRRVTFMAKEELFRNWFIGRIFRHLGGIPVHRGHSNRDALRQAEQVLQKGQILAMFPEGTRSKDLILQSAFPGSALIAFRSKVPILPVAVGGTKEVLHLSCLWRRPRVTLDIGPTFRLPETVTTLNKEQLEEFTDMIMLRIARLLPENLRGKYVLREG
jgi:1-acyl-sn-glycerol-3-phosphate acyltransferase